VADRKDDQIPEGQGPGDDVPGRTGEKCAECGEPLAPDQRYCLNCGARRGLLPGAVVGTLASISSKGKAAAAAASAKVGGSKGDGDDEGGWSWMPSPPAIAIAVIGMLALGVGLGSAMSEIASSAPISTILLEYPHHATEAAPEEEPEEEALPEEEAIAEAPEEEALPEETEEVVVPEEEIERFVPEEEGGEEEELVPFNPLEEEEETEFEEKKLPEIQHVFLIVLGEGGYETTFGAAAGAPYLSRTLPKKGTLIPNYYGVTGGVLANEIALLSGQGPTAESAANCPNYTAITPATVSATAEQVEGTGCVYPTTTQSLPTQLEEKALTWRAYVENMEGGPNRGQAATCRKPTLGGPDDAALGVPGDQYATWRNPVVFFSAIAESTECGKNDIGFEKLTRDLKSKKKTPSLSLIFPDACHSGAEVECEPGAPTGAHGVVALLKTLVPAIMASPAYEEGGLIAITSAEAPQAGEHLDPSGCCLAPSYPNLVAAGLAPAPAATTTGSTSTSTTGTSSTSTTTTTTTEEEAEPTTYTEESLTTSGGGGKVGLLMISPYLEPETVVEGEYANHFTLLKSLEQMFGVEPLGYATEAEMPTLKPELFKTTEEVEAELKEKKERENKKGKKSSKANSAKRRAHEAGLAGLFSRLKRSAAGSPGRAERHRGTS
jgi:phosphatidylinositol-3-phosphatase